ncbi:hypothetical protein LZ32DRAFT_24868 [Colletotrichum eremochloae]|nr:hypothetical protein LZ32DRAFT_24868 [Colletotrichum eremochloae]
MLLLARFVYQISLDESNQRGRRRSSRRMLNVLFFLVVFSHGVESQITIPPIPPFPLLVNCRQPQMDPGRPASLGGIRNMERGVCRMAFIPLCRDVCRNVRGGGFD